MHPTEKYFLALLGTEPSTPEWEPHSNPFGQMLLCPEYNCVKCQVYSLDADLV
uniref:Uncharacterized protein n=1 Tax=Arion vulgaris TaxID=1028688 RepID=A0A0B7BAZ8_9EUPU